MAFMGKIRSYRQACNLAQALDVVGERWTLLIVRELLLGPRRFGQLAANLVGMGTNLLADRLKELEAAGVVRKGSPEAGAKRLPYELTEEGQGLEPVLRELMRWAVRRPPTLQPEQSDAIYRDEWDLIALRLLYRPKATGAAEGVVEFATERGGLLVRVDATGLRVLSDPGASPDVSLKGPQAVFEALVTGRESLHALQKKGRVKVAGDRAMARAFAAGFR